jgi:hypothetical protein
MRAGQGGGRAKLPRMPLRPMNVLLPEDEHARIRQLAKAKGISANEWVRRAVAMQFAYEFWIESGRQAPPPDEPRQPS